MSRRPVKADLSYEELQTVTMAELADALHKSSDSLLAKPDLLRTASQRTQVGCLDAKVGTS